MIITNNEQTDNLLGDVIGLYNDFVPQAFLDSLSKFGFTELQLANFLAKSDYFTEGIMGNAIDTPEMVNVLMGHYDLTADDKDGSPATQANDYFTTRINDSNFEFGDIAVEATHFLLGPKVDRNSRKSELTFPEFIETADVFKSKIFTAYTLAIKNSDIVNPDVFEEIMDRVVPVALAKAQTAAQGTAASGIMDLGEINKFIEDIPPTIGDFYVDKLSPVYYEVIDPDVLKNLKPEVMDSLDPVAIEKLDSAVFERLDPGVIKSLDPTDFERLDPGVIESLDPAVFKDLNPTVFEVVDTPALKDPDPTVTGGPDSAVVKVPDSVVIESLDPAVFKDLNPTVFEVVDPVVVDDSNPPVIEVLDPVVVGGLNPVVSVTAADDIDVEVLGASPLSVDSFIF